MTPDGVVYRITAARLSAICLSTGFEGEKGTSQKWQKSPGFIGKKEWCRGAELNCRHHDFQVLCLPTELPRHAGN